VLNPWTLPKSCPSIAICQRLLQMMLSMFIMHDVMCCVDDFWMVFCYVIGKLPSRLLVYVQCLLCVDSEMQLRWQC